MIFEIHLVLRVDLHVLVEHDGQILLIVAHLWRCDAHAVFVVVRHISLWSLRVELLWILSHLKLIAHGAFC